MTNPARRFFVFCFSIAIAFPMGLAAGPARAADTFKEQLSGRTVKLIIAGSAGGGHDAYGRTLIKHLQIVLPETTFVAQNNRKAGGLLAAQDVQDANGETIVLGLFHPSLIYMQLLDQQQGAFDLSEFKWVASLSHDQRFFGTRRDFPDPTIEGLKQYDSQPLSGTSAAGARSDVELLLTSALTGLRIKVVYGFGSSAQRKAIIAGEIDMIVGSIASNQKIIDSGDLIPVLRITRGGYPDSMAGVPALVDHVRADSPPELLELMEAIIETGRLLTAGPAVEDKIVVALRSAVDVVFASPDYAAENKRLGLYLRPTAGESVDARIKSLISDKPELKTALAKAVECGRQVSEGKIEACDFASW